MTSLKLGLPALCAAALALVWAPAPAAAQTPDLCILVTLDTLSRDRVHRFADLEPAMRLRSASEWSAKAADASRVCPAQPWVQYEAGQIELQLGRDALEVHGPGPEALAHASAALVYAGRMAALPPEIKAAELPRYVLVDARPEMEFGSLRDPLIRLLLTLAEAGHVHPFLTGARPDGCTPTALRDLERFSFRTTTIVTPVEMAFIAGVAEHCRGVTDRDLREPFARLARAHWSAFDLEYQRRDADRADRLTREQAHAHLIEAWLATAALLQGDDPETLGREGVWSANRFRSLLTVMEREGVAIPAYEDALLDRALWTRPDHIATPRAVRALAMAIDELWTPEAAHGALSDAPTRQAGFAIMLLQNAVEREANENGLPEEGRALLRAGTRAHAEGLFRSEGRTDLPPPPNFIANRYRD